VREKEMNESDFRKRNGAKQMINGNGNGLTPPMTYPTRQQCVFELWHAPDASPVVLVPAEGETIEQLKILQRGIEARTKAGDAWAWAAVVVIARWGAYGGMACMGQVSATGAEDFAHPENPDCARLIDEAYHRLIENIAKRYRAHVIDALPPGKDRAKE
jgi:hypothetical protein